MPAKPEIEFERATVSIPKPLMRLARRKVEAIRRNRPEYNFSDLVRDALRRASEPEARSETPDNGRR